jgi:hypothetical protein
MAPAHAAGCQLCAAEGRGSFCVLHHVTGTLRAQQPAHETYQWLAKLAFCRKYDSTNWCSV